MREERALIGGGCFWCIEAAYHKVNGVHSAVSGYAGGKRPNPSYESVCTGVSGHAEVVEVVFDADIISYQEILEIFFALHDPTTLNAQGADRGTQYRSVIFYHNQKQKKDATVVMQEVQKGLEDKIVTQLAEAPTFYAAEAYHQNYYERNTTQGYCQIVIAPKLQKFMKSFKGYL
jgi:peptide-methionine (S)-S-oxide reductase